MTMRKSGFLANMFGAFNSTRAATDAARLMRAGSRGTKLRTASRPVGALAEMLEARVLLAGDHPSLPGTFSPTAGTALTLDLASPLTDAQRGRAMSGMNQGVSGIITAGDDGDFFRFTMPTTPGRATDFVTVLADTISNPNGTDLNSTLDTYVEVYRANAANNGYQLITSGANNGVLSSSNSPVPDGWAGFVGTPGTTYFIRVRANPTPLAQGRTATGAYTLRVDTVSLDYAINSTPPMNVPPAPATDVFGEGDVPGSVAFRQDDLVYRVTVPNTIEFDSLASVGAIADDPTMLDTHLEVYDSGTATGAVTTLGSDRQAGRLTNAFLTFRAARGSTYYVRVRSDELATGRPSTGAFSLAIDMSALEIGVDQTTRLSSPDRADAVAPLAGSNAPQGASSRLYQFTAQGTGTTFITVVGGGGVPFSAERNPGGLGAYPALEDPAVHLYDENGAEIAFIDDTNGFTPQLVVSLTGGQRYFILVEGFDRAIDGGFAVFIEAHYTNLTVDDHVDVPNPPNVIDFGNATPLVFGQPGLLADADGNSILDRSWVQSASSRGRIFAPGDSDLFQFTPPLSSLDEYDGDAGGQGTALYVGGNFNDADRLTANNIATNGRAAPNVAVWDASDWWNAGPGDEGMGLFSDGSGGAINGTIFAMTQWDPDGAGTTFGTVLVAGGRFTDDTGAVVNIALRIFSAQQNRFIWQPIPGLVFDDAGGNADVVRALTVFDLDLPSAAPDLPPSLIVGGKFATILGGTAVNNIFAVRFNGGFFFEPLVSGGTGIPGANAEVRSLAVYDPPAPFAPMGAPTQPPDPPLGLYIGGSFTRNGSNNIVRFGQTGDTMAPPANVFTALGTGVNGAVNAMVVFDDPGVPSGASPERLVIGGAFTGFITEFTNEASDGAQPTPGALPRFDNRLGPAAGIVHALTVWNPPTTPGQPGQTEELVIGGVGPDGGVVSFHNGFGRSDSGFNAPVRALTVMVDDEAATAGHQVIYAGGEFTEQSDLPGVPMNRVAKFDDANHDGLSQWVFLKGGVDGLAPGEIGATSVFALSSFDDHVAGTWDRNERPASRVSIRVTLPTDPVTGATDSFLDSAINVYDSNFQLIYSNLTIAPPFPNPSGSIDPSLTAGPGFNQQFVLPGLWGGETYFIEVVGNGSTGRYNISVLTDAIPPEIPDNLDGRYQDVNRGVFDVVDEGQWANAPELDLNTSGDAYTFDFLTTTGRQAFNGWDFKRTAGTRSEGALLRSERDFLTGIESVTDTDLFQFRASATGTVEIRLSTLGLLDQFIQTDLTQTPNPLSPLLGDFAFNDFGAWLTTMNMNAVQTRTYNSSLDGAIKVFNNDFELLGANDDSRQVTGFRNVFRSGAHSDRTQNPTIPDANFTQIFDQRDPRVVIPVVGGETYFIQVESAYREAFGIDPANVDWRRATGSYQLLINNTQASNGIDDYENLPGAAALLFNSTAIPIDEDGAGIISGTIDNRNGNPDDNDLFSFIAPTRGQVSFRLTSTSPSLRPIIRVFDATGAQVATQTGLDGGTVTINRSVTQGERLFIVVDGDGITEGTYDLTVQTTAFTDDHTKEGDWGNATPISLNSFLGQFTGAGRIENAADNDLFTFTAAATEIARVTVTPLDGTLTPFVFIYEISSTAADPMDGIPEYRLVGAGGGIPNSPATVDFAVTEGRPYFIVVYGSNLNADFGRYNLTVNVTPTDDHPNLADFPLATQLDLAATFNPLTFTASATDTGNIEINTDDDVFRFVAPAGGTATVTVTTPNSGLAGNVLVYDSAQNLLGTGVASNGTATVTVNIAANQQYYVRVDVGATGAGQPDDVGTYTITVNTAPVDDYANQGQFGAGNVGVITLNPGTGFGTRSGLIVPNTDSDLFRVAALFTGNLRVRVTTVGSSFNPKLRIFRNDVGNTEITGATSNGDTASLTFTATAGETYFILVLPNDGATGATAVGTYLVEVTNTQTGPGPGPGPGPDDHANAGEFGDATLLNLDTRTGFGAGTGIINFGGDTDLFKFVPAATGRAGVQVRTPSGGLVDGRVKVFDRNFVLVAEDVAGVPGATASVNFNAVVNSTADIYYVLVEPIGANTGSYTVEVSSQPTTHYLYYPEGFSGATIDEFVPFFNPGSTAVNYQVYVRYESGPQNNNPIASGTIGARSRGGITISTRGGASLVDLGRPYALEIQSTGELGATMSHYDFDVSIGESFTNRLSTTWTFAQVNKDPANFRDFIVFYNPNSTDATLNVELFYANGTTRSFTQTVRALRRGGINVDTDGRVPFNGRFGVRITSNIGIVSAVSSYNLSNNGGDGLLGDPDGGTTAGVIPNVSTGGGVTSTLSFLNTNPTPATITVTASYARVDLPDLVRVITVQPGRQFSTSLANLGLINSQTAGITYTSTAPVTASVIQYQNGDGDTTNAATTAAKQYYFGDLFINPAFAGVTYIERLGLYNPSATAIDVNIRFVFVDGTSADLIVNVAARDFSFVQIDQATQVLSRGRITAFSLDITAQTPIVASLTHYDLFLNGGWSTIGSPIGLTVPVSTII